MPRNCPDEQFNDRIKSIEQQFTSKGSGATEKKPKDLLRAIGKIESNDWNIREIEKKIEQSKKTEVGKSREKVPKWSKEQFMQLQTKMANPDDKSDPTDERFKEIDETIKNLDKQLKGGNMLDAGERGKNKVASIAGNFVKKDSESTEDKAPVQKSVNFSRFYKLKNAGFNRKNTFLFYLGFESEFGFQYAKLIRLSFLQKKSLFNGKAFGRRSCYASRLS